MLNRILTFLDRRSRILAALLGLALTALVAALDLETGPEISISIFYLIPVALVSWVVGRRGGVYMAMLAAAAWLLADVEAGHVYSNVFIPAWNMLVRLGIFLVVALTLSQLRSALEHAEYLANRDPLTGLANRRYLTETAGTWLTSLGRARQPVTALSVKTDGIQLLNQRQGLLVGDRALSAVAEVLKRETPPDSLLARWGGAGFLILVPRTDLSQADGLVGRLRHALEVEMARYGHPVTFVISGASAAVSPHHLDILLQRIEMVVAEGNGDRVLEVAPG